jgi:hypothetical protein
MSGTGGALVKREYLIFTNTERLFLCPEITKCPIKEHSIGDFSLERLGLNDLFYVFSHMLLSLGCVLDKQSTHRNDLATLRGIIRGPGNYATPSADRISRLVEGGLIKKKHGKLWPTVKGRLVAFLSK